MVRAPRLVTRSQREDRPQGLIGRNLAEFDKAWLSA